jgi:uncharacterized membrane protein YkoI
MKRFRNRKFMIALVAILIISFVGLSANAIASSNHDASRITEKVSLPVYLSAANNDHSAATTTTGAEIEAALAPTTAEPPKISVDQVKQIVLEKVPDATLTEIELDKDDGILTYNVEANNSLNKYEFYIDANTGVILKFETDVIDDHTVATTPSTSASALDEQAKISVDQVKQIVADKVPGAVIKELELDECDGRLTYEVEAYNGQTEYDFEIDAITGDILEFESCIDDDTDGDIDDDSDSDIDDVDDDVNEDLDEDIDEDIDDDVNDDVEDDINDDVNDDVEDDINDDVDDVEDD